MAAARITCGTCCPKPVLVAVSRRHDAVGCHQDRTIEGRKLLLLLPPCIAVVAREIRIFLECRIVVRGKHLGMSVNIDSGSLCLLEQHLEIPQIMAGNQNARILADADIHAGNLRISVGFCVGLVEQCHSFDAVFSGLKGKSNQIVHGQRIIQGFCKSLLDEGVDLLIVLKKRVCMLGISGETLEPVGDQLTERTDVLVLCGENADRDGLCVKTLFTSGPGGCIREIFFVFKPGEKLLFDGKSFYDITDDRFPVEVCIGDGRKQVYGHEVIDFLVNCLSFLAQSGGHEGQSLCDIDQKILHVRYFRLLAADAGNRASLASGCFLTLITEHFVFHFVSLFLSLACTGLLKTVQ